MIDILSVTDDIGLLDTQIMRASNILSVQIDALEYEPELGIDLKYFLSEEFRFQNESFKAYLIQRLASYSINVASVVEVVENLYNNYTFNLTPDESSDSLIAR